MERLEQLISKLNEQFEHNADPSQLLVTAQLLEAELVQLSASSRRPYGTSKVAVVMPSGRYGYQAEQATAVASASPAVEEHKPVRVPEDNQSRPEEKITIPQPVQPQPVQEQPAKNGSAGKEAAQEQGSNGWHFDPLKDIPTLAQQGGNGKELNEIIGSAASSSLNDKLKEEVVEVGHRLNDSPVRDLKRAIGINDRFVFINELFRGDEVMYERSIKTINSFRIFPEAEYWIERELKVKLGWDELKPTTRHFYQLVKRRFS